MIKNKKYYIIRYQISGSFKSFSWLSNFSTDSKHIDWLAIFVKERNRNSNMNMDWYNSTFTGYTLVLYLLFRSCLLLSIWLLKFPGNFIDKFIFGWHHCKQTLWGPSRAMLQRDGATLRIYTEYFNEVKNSVVCSK